MGRNKENPYRESSRKFINVLKMETNFSFLYEKKNIEEEINLLIITIYNKRIHILTYYTKWRNEVNL